MNKTLRKPKQRGEWVELQFMARAAAHGFTVSKPWGDSARYDFILESRGQFRRVQVKSTFQKPSRAMEGYVAALVSRSSTGKDRTYTSQEIDFFAFYVIPVDVWYILPIREIGEGRYVLFLNPFQRKNKYFRYLEAWHLLR